MSSIGCAVFNLQASDYVHCEEEEGTNRVTSLHTYTLSKFFINKVDFFPGKKFESFKKFRKFHFILQFYKKICKYTYIFTKCNYILKFLISLKLHGVKTFQAVPPPKPGLFSIARFLRLTENLHEQKHFLET